MKTCTSFIVLSLFIGFTLCAEDKKASSEQNQLAKSNLSITDLVQSDSVSIHANIKFIDRMKIMGESEPGQAERREIENKRDLAAKELQEASQNLENEKRAYVNKVSMMTDKARENEEKKLMRIERDLKNSITEKEEELKLDVQIATEKLALGAEEAVVELAKSENIDVVFDKMGQAIYVSDNFDMTDKVIDRINEKHRVKLAQQKRFSHDTSTRVAENSKHATREIKA